MKSSKYLLSTIDKAIGIIDDRLKIKKPVAGAFQRAAAPSQYIHANHKGMLLSRGTETFNNRSKQVSVLY
jgi:UDP-N-acetylmuramyl pentapeptide phosphotransferase/UDP-N-acetylglucosamine-1-phosphate transferase